MQKRSEKKVSYRQRLARFVAPIGGRTWRALIWQLVLILLMLAAFVGQDAQAVTTNLMGMFEKDVTREFNIDNGIVIQGTCTQADSETRKNMWWEVTDKAAKVLETKETDKSLEMDGFTIVRALYGNANFKPEIKPGETYTLKVVCTTANWPIREDHSISRTFKVRDLSGTYTAVVDASDNLLVSGTVGNGANSITVYLIDENQKMHLFAEKNNLTSGFDIREKLPPGKHELRVYADYGKYSVRLGTSFVATRPVVTLDALPAFTNDPKFELSGRASAPDGITRRVFEGRNRKNQKINVRLPASVEYPSVVQENGDLKHNGDFSGDGKFSLHYAVTTSLGATVSSDSQTIHVDTRVPDVKGIFPSAASYIKRDQKFKANVIDLDMTGESGSGVDSVQLGYADENGTFIWLPMQLGTGDDYLVDLPFDKLPTGEVEIKVWAQDRAKNETETPVMIYKKAAPPTVTMETPVTPTTTAKFSIKGHAHSDAGLENAWVTWWKKGDEKNKKSVALNPASGTDADIDHEINLPADEKYLLELSTRSLDGQSGKSKPLEVELDATEPIVTIVLPKENAILEKELTLEFRVEDAGIGVKNVQIQLISGSNVWTENIPDDGAGNYVKTLSLDEVNAGPFEVTIWADDQLGNVAWKYVTYTKQPQAADALKATLQFLAANGDAVKDAFYPDQERLLRLSVTPATTINGLEIAYKLPAGLKPQSPARLHNGAGMTPELQKAINEQLSNWRDDGPLLTGIDLPNTQMLEVDIPFKTKLAIPDLKIGGTDAPTYFDVSGSNITGNKRAETNWHADWKKSPVSVNNPLVSNFDLSAVSTVAIFDNLSGGYDTAAPEQWNRNTLHCADSNVQCEDHMNDTSIKLLFKERDSKQTIALTLKGQRELSLINGGTRKTPLGFKENAGADAEARFSVSLSKEELEKFPTAGQWSATLDMELQDAADAGLADFRRDITFNISDTTGMAMTPPQIQLLPASHRDHDNSGGFSAGDELIYRISYNAARNLSNVQLDYDLPPGLERSGVAATFADGSDIKQQETLRKDGSKALLENGLAMKKGESLVIDLPLRIKQSSEMQIVSQVSASADGHGAMTSEKAILQVQQRFPAAQALTLTFYMVAPPVAGQAMPSSDKVDQADKAGATVAHKSPFVYRITLAAQKQTVKNASLRYRLPGGLSRTDAPIVFNVSSVSKGPAAALLNAQWNGDADDELLAANTDLSPGESLTLDIPVVVKDAVGNSVSVKSTVNAGAGNLSDGLRAAHTVKVRERLAGNDRVMVVKSSDAKAQVQPGTRIAYQIRVSNQTSNTVRNLLIRDRAADHTEMVASSCGELPAETCSTFTLNDSDIVEGQMTHDALCKTPIKKSVPGGRHVFWCLNGDLDPLADYVVDYTLQVNGSAPPP
jgi:hypothetical protein